MKIIYEDGDILVCFKEAGLAVESARLTQPDLERQLLRYLREQQEGEGGKMPYLGLVHRLDQPVQGLLVFAKTPQSAAELSRQSREGLMKKEYLALVHAAPEGSRDGGSCGAYAAEEGFILLEDFLVRDPRTNTSRVTAKGTKGAKAAKLLYRDVTDDPAFAALMSGWEKSAFRLLRIRLLTGRHHQIRVQLSYKGMPIAGDRKYGADLPAALCFPALCAYSLSFSHPAGREAMNFSLPADQIRFT